MHPLLESAIGSQRNRLAPPATRAVWRLWRSRRTARRLGSSLRRLAHDQRGASALEFAIVGPLLIVLILGLVQYGMVFIKLIDMRFQANHFARAVAARALTPTDAETACNAQLGPKGIACATGEDATSFTVTLSFNPVQFGPQLLPSLGMQTYTAYQVKYAVQ